MRIGGAFLLVVLLACSDAPRDADAATDGGPDAGDAGVDAAPPIDPPQPPALPRLDPCPAGWRRVDGEIAVCDPYPAAGASSCGPGETHFPGEPGCRAVGTACNGELPEGGTLHVRAGAPPGGDGSPTAPFATIGEAIAVATAGDVVAVAAGTYDEIVQLPNGVTLRGCGAATVIAPSMPGGGFGALNADDGTASASDVVLRPADRYGVIVWSHAELDIERVVIDGARGVGAWALGTLRGRDVLITGTRLDGSGILGNGLQVSGGSIELRGVVIERSESHGVNATVGTIRLQDAVVRDTIPAVTEISEGWGVIAGGGTTIDLERVLIERATVLGIAAFGGHVRLTDVVIRETLGLSGATMPGGVGLALEEGGTVEAERVLVTDSTQLGMASVGSTLTATDLLVRDTNDGSPLQAGGRGLELVGGTATLSRAAFVRNSDMTIAVLGAGGRLEATDLTVTDTAGDRGGYYGRALQVQQGAEARITRALFARNREAAVLAASPGTLVQLLDVEVRETLPRDCAATTCADEPVGHGVVSLLDARITAERFRITRSALAGLQLARGGAIDLAAGEVSENPIGANVQTEGFDLARITDRVVYRDNGRDLDSMLLAVPDDRVP